MKASELRLGNLITSDGEIFTVDEIRNDFVSAGALGIYPAGFDCDLGIPLTEEWLLKFGFFVSERITSEHFFGAALFQKGNSDEFVIPYEDGYHYIRDISSSSFDGSTEYRTTVIHYVHQLQNLYYALTGTELTIKE